MEKLLLAASSVGVLASVATLILLNWIVAVGLFVATAVFLALGLDWAIARHHAEQEQRVAPYAYGGGMNSATEAA